MRLLLILVRRCPHEDIASIVRVKLNDNITYYVYIQLYVCYEYGVINYIIICVMNMLSLYTLNIFITPPLHNVSHDANFHSSSYLLQRFIRPAA